LPQLFIEAVTLSRSNLKTKTTKTRLDNYIVHIIYLLLFHLQSLNSVALLGLVTPGR